MNIYGKNEIKNIAILGSSGSGKTTLAEAMLFEGGAISKRGSVQDGNTVSDHFPVEKEYGYSVFSTLFSVPWKEWKINFIDCPGSDDFVGNAISAMQVTDTALMVVNAQYGVEVGLVNQFPYTERFKKPVIFLINQIDNEHADYDRTVDELKSSFGSKVVLVQYPVKTGVDFNEVVDVLTMKMYRWGPQGGKPDVLEIPDSERAKADELHKALVESAAEHDEHLMELFFEKESLTEDEMRQGIRKGLISRDMFPIFCASAAKDMCVRRTLEFIGNIVPCTDKLEAPKATDGTVLPPDENAPTVLYFFKNNIEPHVGDILYFKVISGTVREGDDLTNTTHNHDKERISQLLAPYGPSRERVPEMKAGDIGCTVKLKTVSVGDTLCGKGIDVQLPQIEYPAPKFRRAIVAENQGDTEKMNAALYRMHSEDPTWVIEQSKELKQTLVYGQGEFHLRTLKWRIENNEKIPVKYLEPKIPYRETITKVARADYRHKKQSGGAGQFGEVHLIVEPYTEDAPLPASYKIGGQEYKVSAKDTQVVDLDWGGKLVVVNSIVGGAIDARFIPAIQKGIMERMEQGPLTGSYARDVRVVIYDGKMHPVDSNELSFMLAGRHAFADAFRNAGPKVLEPIYEMKVQIPAEFLGDVMSDLQNRRGLILGMESKGGYEELNARVPLSEISTYSTTLSSITGGRGSFSLKFADYELVPQEIQEKITIKPTDE